MKNYLDVTVEQIGDMINNSIRSIDKDNGDISLFVSAEARFLDNIQEKVDELSQQYSKIDWFRDGFETLSNYGDDMVRRYFSQNCNEAMVSMRFSFFHDITSMKKLSTRLEEIINDGELNNLEISSIIPYLKRRTEQMDFVDIHIDIKNLIPLGVVQDSNGNIKDLIVCITEYHRNSL